MPKRRFSSKKKRAVTKRRRSRPRRVPLPLGGFPDRKIVKLKYAELITLNPNAAESAVPTMNHFRANSLYDPNQSGTGHQPRGFDELAAIYDHYTVIGSKLKVTFENDVDIAALTAGQYCFAMLQDTTSAPGTLVDLLEEGSRNQVAYRQRNTTTGRSITLTRTYSPHKFFGIPKKDSVVSNALHTPNVGSNPAEDAIYTVGVICARTTSTDPPPVVARVEIEYIAVFTEKRPQSSS